MWKEFRRRFPNVTIREGYGLTEASVGFLNYTDEVGPIGRAGFFNKAANTHTHRYHSSFKNSQFYLSFVKNASTVHQSCSASPLLRGRDSGLTAWRLLKDHLLKDHLLDFSNVLL